MISHLQLRDGKVIPTIGTRLYQEGLYIVFELQSGEKIRELYNYGQTAFDAAYDNYVDLILGRATPALIFLTDSVSGDPVALSVVNGVLKALGTTMIYGTPPTSFRLVDSGNGLVTTFRVDNGVLKASQ